MRIWPRLDLALLMVVMISACAFPITFYISSSSHVRRRCPRNFRFVFGKKVWVNTCEHRYVYYLNTTLRIISFVRTSLNMWLYPTACIVYTYVCMYIFAGKYLDIVHAYVVYLYIALKVNRCCVYVHIYIYFVVYDTRSYLCFEFKNANKKSFKHINQYVMM